MFGDMQSGSCAAQPRSRFSPQQSGGEVNSGEGYRHPLPAQPERSVNSSSPWRNWIPPVTWSGSHPSDRRNGPP